MLQDTDSQIRQQAEPIVSSQTIFEQFRQVTHFGFSLFLFTLQIYYIQLHFYGIERGVYVLVPISHTLHTESTLRFSTTHSHHHTKIADVIISNLIINNLLTVSSLFYHHFVAQFQCAFASQLLYLVTMTISKNDTNHIVRSSHLPPPAPAPTGWLQGVDNKTIYCKIRPPPTLLILTTNSQYLVRWSCPVPSISSDRN